MHPISATLLAAYLILVGLAAFVDGFSLEPNVLGTLAVITGVVLLVEVFTGDLRHRVRRNAS